MMGILVSEAAAPPAPPTDPVAELLAEADPLAVASIPPLVDDPNVSACELLDEEGARVGALVGSLEAADEDTGYCHSKAGVMRCGSKKT